MIAAGFGLTASSGESGFISRAIGASASASLAGHYTRLTSRSSTPTRARRRVGSILRRLFRLNRVVDQAQYERILSLEYAFPQFGGRVKVDF
jgi:hypothetical protein